MSRLADLPTHTYVLRGNASDLLTSHDEFTSLARAVRKNIQDMVAEWHIQDKATLKRLYGTLINLDMIERNAASALTYIDKRRLLEERPADKLLSGIIEEALVAAWQDTEGKEEEVIRMRFMQNVAARVETLPWEVVHDDVESIKGRLELITGNVLIGMVQSEIDPAVQKTNSISGDMADQIIGFRFYLDILDPFKGEVVEALEAYISSHKHTALKADIWKERAVDLTGVEGLHCVILGIWDTGVDTAVVERQLVVGGAEDGEGEIADTKKIGGGDRGIAFDLNGEKTSGLLYPLSPEETARIPALKDDIKGMTDIQSAVDSPEAQALKKKLGALQPDEIKPFMEELALFVNYMHGTHVAGIAVQGNSYARIVTARITFDHRVIPEPLTMERARKTAENYAETVAFLQQHGARVVNMSWRWTFKEVERNLEVNGIGKGADQRRRLAREIFDTIKGGLYEALAGAPEILFFTAAGNEDSDVSFSEVIPSCFDLPNVLTVGAVDQAGEEASFTSFGERVSVYANGFEVESWMPGGERIVMSGTSMAAPAVANLAAKLLAFDPSISTDELTALIRGGADQSEDGRLMLLNPRRSVERLKARRK